MRISPRIGRDVMLSVGLLIICIGLFYIYYSPQPKLRRLTITGGNRIGQRHNLAEDLVAECKRHQIELELVETQGSEDALSQVDAGKIDLALVQGGFAGESFRHVQQVTPLHVEPLHLLVQPQLAAVIKDQGLSALAGRTINVGSIGSGTCALVQEFLGFLGLEAAVNESQDLRENQYRCLHLSYDFITSFDPAVALPDAIFMISSLPSPIAKQLIDEHSYQLVQLPYSEAFALDALRDHQPYADSIPIDQRRVYDATIPAYTYSVAKSQPPRLLDSLGTRLLLVANEQVAPDTIDRLLQVVFDSSLTKDSRPPVEISILDGPQEFPRHAGAARFIQHHKPLIVGEVMGVLDNGLAIVATLLGGAFFLTQWYRQQRQFRREQEFQGYLDAVIDIEHRLLSFDVAAKMKVSELISLRQRLSDLKSDVVKRFSRGEIEGEGLMLGFMTLANDARNHITRMLLHERDNVEAIAEREQRPIEELWSERVNNNE